jgi:hypothetical protein
MELLALIDGRRRHFEADPLAGFRQRANIAAAGRVGLALQPEDVLAPVGAMVGAMLGLLAFILGVTFSLAFNRFHDRKIALLREAANAIRMTYLQAAVIPEPHRSEVRRIVRDYAGERLQWAGVEKVNVRSSANELLDQLWAQAAIVGSQNPGTADVFLRSVSKVIDLNATRLMLRDRSHIPTFFWFALYLLAILSLASMGYHGGVAGTNRSPATIAVAIAFSVVIMMIADVDRPGEGFIDVNQQPMIDTRNFVNASKP